MGKRNTTTSKKPSKAPVKRKSTPTKPTKAKKPQSFKLSKDDQKFTSFKVTEQTVYWLVLATAIAVLGLWIMKVNLEVQALYDQIDQNIVAQMELNDKYNLALRDKSLNGN